MLDHFTAAYIEAALWSSIDDNQDPLDDKYDVNDLAPECLEKMVGDCKAFQEANSQWINQDHCKTPDPEGRAGHDFWLTRCGHGAGFWDGDWSEEADAAMTEYSKEAGNVDLYVGDDGKIYCN